MRVVTSFCVFLLAGSVAAADLTAQVPRPGGPPFQLQPPSAQANTTVPGVPTLKHRVLTGLGGAALGAGVAFFASQVSESDWEETPGTSEVNRGLWAALGGGVGFAVGFSFPISGSPPQDRLTAPGGRTVISYYEIQEVSVDNAWDIIRQLRPEWLNSRPPDNLGESDFETTTVYMDDFRFGDTSSLYSIHVATIESIRFISAAQATARWGPGNVMGVIQIITIG
jgi:hypothetical protein